MYDIITRHVVKTTCDDLNARQVLCLLRMPADGCQPGDMIDRGYYHGSNASYNINVLVTKGYLQSDVRPGDKRSRLLTLTKKGRAVRQTYDAIAPVTLRVLG